MIEANSWKEINHPWADLEKTYSKSEIGKQQLETAVWLFLNRIDLVSAITLAGASGEILHKLLEFSNGESFFEYGRTLFQKLFRHETHKKEKYIYHFRELTGIYPLRHKKSGSPDELEIDIESGAEMAITAAVLDCIKLYGKKEPIAISFLNYLWVVKDGQKMMKDYEPLINPSRKEDKQKAKQTLEVLLKQDRKKISPKKYKLIDLAEAQLQTAIILFLTGKDLISSITLAGAADVIFCQLLKDRGEENFTDHVLKSENDPKKTISEMGREINDMFCINALKHMDSADEHSVTMNLRENAIGAILKALPNFKELRSLDKDFIIAFRLWMQANLDPKKYNVNGNPNWTSES